MIINQQPTLIITVDDLGLHPAVERAVRILSDERKIHAGSLMANGPFLEQALSLNGKLMLGAHLNFLRGKPLLSPDKIPSLVDKNGLFLGDYKQLLTRYYLGQLRPSELYREAKAQIVYLHSLGVQIAHLDSEKHCHVWPKLFKVVLSLAKEFKIPRVRYPYELSQSCFPVTGQLRAALLRYWCKQAPSQEVRKFCLEFAWGLVHQKELLQEEPFKKYKEKLPKGSRIEMICHPGLPEPQDPPLDAAYGKTRVSDMWLPEFEALKNFKPCD